MARLRTQKTVSRRIDLSYFKRPHPLRTGRKAMVFLFTALAIGLVTFFSLGGEGRLHNPGALTSAHAAWQHDCRACHAADGKGGFALTVSDASCLACHDGSMHHKNQTDASLVKWTLETTPGKPSDHFTAKNCVSCHTEHRGHDLLVGKDDRLCITCHDDVSKHAKQPPESANHAVAFTVADHPRFGRSLTKPGAPLAAANWVDPTNVKYNHAVHNKQAVLKDNCVACHSTDDPQLTLNEPTSANPPPYKTDKDRPTAWIKGDRRANIQPISYERHCVGCHTMELPGKIAVPHEELAVVRAALSGTGHALSARLAGMSQADKDKLLVTEITTGRPPKKVKKVITESEWIEARLKDLGDTIDKAVGSKDAKFAALKAGLRTPTTQPAGAGFAQGPDVNVLEYYVTNGMGLNSCVTCHEVKGDVPALAYASAKPSVATTAPTSNPQSEIRNPQSSTVLAYTVPTGIPSGPRKWFTASRFDHYAHRSSSCLDCHAAATTSKLTSDVLSPDIDTASPVTGQSCVSCHRQDTSSLAIGEVRGAAANCVTCHGFHDETLERSLNGSIDASTGKPVPTRNTTPTAATPPPATRPVADAR